MGSLLSVPNLDKDTACASTAYVAYGCAAHQGWRTTMEDAHALIPALDDSAAAPSAPRAFFAVYDGHGGPDVAHYCARHLHRTLCATPEYARGDYARALELAYIATDAQLATPAGQRELAAICQQLGGPNTTSDSSSSSSTPTATWTWGGSSSNSSSSSSNSDSPERRKRGCAEEQGCTAVAVLLDFAGGQLYCANTGDSRAVAVCGGVCTALSSDHKPGLDDEHARIERAGGFVKGGRVNGNLNLSRTLGDLCYKHNAALGPGEQIISCVPDVRAVPLAAPVDFVVLACDGVWDVLSSDAAAALVRAMLLPSAQMDAPTRARYLRTSSSSSTSTSSSASSSDCESSTESEGEGEGCGSDDAQPWPGDVAASLEELLELAAVRLIDRCVAREASPFTVGCDNMTAVIVMPRTGAFAARVQAALDERLRGTPSPAPHEEQQ